MSIIRCIIRGLSVWLLLFSTIICEAQVPIRGKVTDSDGNALPGVLVKLEDTEAYCITTTSGHYNMEVAPGSYRLTAALLGFKEVTKEIKVAAQPVTQDFALLEDYQMLGEVVVLAPRHSKAIQNSTYAAVSLDVKPVVASLGSLNQLVTQSSGIRIREEGGVGSNFDLSISGLSGNAIRYFINGVPLSSLGSSVTLANIPVNLVERVEIYKGVVPPELGLDALGGAVNIITKRDRGNYLDLSLNAGSFHTYGADLNAQYRHRSTGLTIKGTASYKQSKNDYLMRDVEVWNEEAYEYQLQDRRRFHDGYKSALGQLEVGITNKRWADEAFLGISYSTSESEIQTGLRQTKVVGEAVRHRNALALSARYNKRDFLVEGLSANLYAAHTDNHIILTDTAYRMYKWDGSFIETNYNEVLKRTRAIRHTLRPTWTTRVNLAYATSPFGNISFNYTLTSSKNHRYDDLDREFDETTDYISRHILGLSYGHYFLNGRLHTSLFLKDYIFRAEIQQQDLPWLTGAKDAPKQATKNHIGYGLGVRYTLADPLSFKLSFEKATRLPTSREFLGNGINIYPNLLLKPEQAYNFNVGLYGHLNVDNDHLINYESNIFFRNVTDYIHRIILSDVESQYDNIGASQVAGVEAELKYNYRSIIDATLNATYLDERDKGKETVQGKVNPTYNYRIPNKPWIYANALVGANWHKPFGLPESVIRFNLSLGYIHWFYLTWEAFGSNESKAIIPTQYNLSGGVTWSFRQDRYTLSIQGDNLLDKKQYDNYMLQKPGRSILLKFRLFII